MINTWVVLPAGGFGSRFSNDKPKQYWEVAKKTILLHTIELFNQYEWVSQIIIPCHPAYQSELNQIEKVTTVDNGDIRLHSVLKALDYLAPRAQGQDWVLVHDAVRPCLHPADLNNLLSELNNNPVGGILGKPVSDTLKMVDNDNIKKTVPRENLWHALTPQMFRFEVLYAALQAVKNNNNAVTDDAAAIEAQGLTPKIVKANHPNPKLTYSEDLAYIKVLLENKL